MEESGTIIVEPSKNIDIVYKFAAGAIISVTLFLIGATFWAGSTYNRIEGIEGELKDMNIRLGKVGDLSVMRYQINELQKQIAYLQEIQDSERRLRGTK